MKITTTLFLLSFLVLKPLAQTQECPDLSIDQESRFEMERTITNRFFQVLNAGEKGMAIFSATGEKKKGKEPWIYTRLDKDLGSIGSEEIMLDPGATVLGYEYFNSDFYLLIQPQEFNYSKLELLLLQEDGGFQKKGINTLFKSKVQQFTFLDDKVALLGKKNGKDQLFIKGINDQKTITLSSLAAPDAEILDIMSSEDKGFLTALLRYKDNKREKSYFLKTYTSDGLLVSEFRIELNEDRRILDVVTSGYNGGEQWVFGTFTDRPGELSQGFFAKKYFGGRQFETDYIYFHDLGNFFNFLSPKASEKMMQRLDAGTKNKIDFYYDLQIGEVKTAENGEKWLSTNAKFPNQYIRDENGARQSVAHNLLLLFGTNGTQSQDYLFKLKNFLFPQWQKINLPGWDNPFVSYQLKSDKVTYQIHTDKLGTCEQKTTTIEPLTANEKQETPGLFAGRIRPWYENAAYAYGETEVVSQSGIKKVYYIQKLVFK